jgi:hypothetical protein
VIARNLEVAVTAFANPQDIVERLYSSSRISVPAARADAYGVDKIAVSEVAA